MGVGLWEDWCALGTDVIKLLAAFGSKLSAGVITPFPNGSLTSGYAFGMTVHDGTKSSVIALHPDTVTILNHLHDARWETERAKLGWHSPSLSQQSVERIDRRSTSEHHALPAHKQIPTLANCDRIGVMLQSIALAQLPPKTYEYLLSSATGWGGGGNPFHVPLQLIEGPSDFIPLTSRIAAVTIRPDLLPQVGST
jgi:hypothetical protein